MAVEPSDRFGGPVAGDLGWNAPPLEANGCFVETLRGAADPLLIGGAEVVLVAAAFDPSWVVSSADATQAAGILSTGFGSGGWPPPGCRESASSSGSRLTTARPKATPPSPVLSLSVTTFLGGGVDVVLTFSSSRAARSSPLARCRRRWTPCSDASAAFSSSRSRSNSLKRRSVSSTRCAASRQPASNAASAACAADRSSRPRTHTRHASRRAARPSRSLEVRGVQGVPEDDDDDAAVTAASPLFGAGRAPRAEDPRKRARLAARPKNMAEMKYGNRKRVGTRARVSTP
mmetsp:Transcript_14576/g.58213  ORF Transcript_14576/g.58213 Transcript_14576/m.58213 type:complete len:289 (+) Transcript_14576:1387-2253(+)